MTPAPAAMHGLRSEQKSGRSYRHIIDDASFLGTSVQHPEHIGHVRPRPAERITVFNARLQRSMFRAADTL